MSAAFMDIANVNGSAATVRRVGRLAIQAQHTADIPDQHSHSPAAKMFMELASKQNVRIIRELTKATIAADTFSSEVPHGHHWKS